MKTAFESIKRGLKEALQYAEGKSIKANVNQFEMVNVKKIKSNIGMTQTISKIHTL